MCAIHMSYAYNITTTELRTVKIFRYLESIRGKYFTGTYRKKKKKIRDTN